MALVAAHLAWQISRLDINDGANCLATFKSNRDLGLIVLARYPGRNHNRLRG